MSSVALHPDIDPMNESWYTIFIVSRCGYPGLCFSIFYKKEQERFAKTVTNNLPILSVLAERLFLLNKEIARYFNIGQKSVYKGFTGTQISTVNIPFLGSP